MNRQSRSKLFAIGDAVGERVLEVAAHAVTGLRRDDVRSVRCQQHAAGDLDVAGAGVVAGRPESDRFEGSGVGGVQHRDAVAEHMAEIDVLAIDHDLRAVGPAALIGAGDVPALVPDPLGPGSARRRARFQARRPQRKSPAGSWRRVMPCVTILPLSCSCLAMVASGAVQVQLGWSGSPECHVSHAARFGRCGQARPYPSAARDRGRPFSRGALREVSSRPGDHC